jgi:hypothetical protein
MMSSGSVWGALCAALGIVVREHIARPNALQEIDPLAGDPFRFQLPTPERARSRATRLTEPGTSCGTPFNLGGRFVGRLQSPANCQGRLAGRLGKPWKSKGRLAGLLEASPVRGVYACCWHVYACCWHVYACCWHVYACCWHVLADVNGSKEWYLWPWIGRVVAGAQGAAFAWRHGAIGERVEWQSGPDSGWNVAEPGTLADLLRARGTVISHGCEIIAIVSARV